MRHFTYNGLEPIQQIKGYCHILENDINSLISYIDYFTPNYKILNYTPGLSTQYYSNDSLKEKQYILPVKIVSVEDFLTENFQDDPDSVKGEDSLIVFPSYLKLHEGLLNRFPEYDHSHIGVLLYYGLQEDINYKSLLINDMTYYFLPENILSYNFNDPIIQLVNKTQDKVVLQNVRLVGENSDIAVTPDMISVASATTYYPAYGPSLFQRFEPAHIIVSLARAENEKDIPGASARTDPANYLVCRFAAAGTYYYNNNFNTWTYSERATDLYGEHIVLTFASLQLRYYTTQETNWPTNSFMQYYDAYRYKNNSYEFLIHNQKGAVWNSQILSHQLVYQQNQTSSQSFDTFVCDDSSEISLANIDSHRIPRYTINIEKANTWSFDNIQTVLW